MNFPGNCDAGRQFYVHDNSASQIWRSMHSPRPIFFLFFASLREWFFFTWKRICKICYWMYLFSKYSTHFCNLHVFFSFVHCYWNRCFWWENGADGLFCGLVDGSSHCRGSVGIFGGNNGSLRTPLISLSASTFICAKNIGHFFRGLWRIFRSDFVY